MVLAEVIIGIIIGIGLGALIGIIFAKIILKRANKKIIKGLVDVIEGRKENKTQIDGKIINVNKFKVTNEEGEDILIDFNDPSSLTK